MIQERIERRVVNDGRVTVKIYASSDGPAGVVPLCHAEDLSSRGFRITSSRGFADDTALRLQILVEDPPTSFVHSAHVRWSRERDDGLYDTGFQLLESSGSLMEEWERVVKILGMRLSGIE